MRLLMTSLGAWDGIERECKQKHGITFPLAILRQVLVEAGADASRIDVLEGARRPRGPWGSVLVSVMDPRHMWRLPDYLRDLDVPVWSEERGEEHPIIVAGGQACYAPGPILPMVDVAYVGEAEVSAAAMVDALTGPGSRQARLGRVAELPGCWVPSVHGMDHQIKAVYADDVSLTSRVRLEGVNLRDVLRVEIARGCPHRCPFCVLTARQPYRWVPADTVIGALRRAREQGLWEVHLQAGDAESHPEIDRIRAEMVRLKMYDQSWTGRLDRVKGWHFTTGKSSDYGSKHFAFGIEGVSSRLRECAGKRGYTNEWITERVLGLWNAGATRITFHLIGGLPGETEEDYQELRELFEGLESAAMDLPGKRRTIFIARQPFGPMPHTAWQREAPGLHHDRIGVELARMRGSSYLCLFDREGQNAVNAALAAIPMRMGPECAPVLTGPEPRVSARVAIPMLRQHLQRLNIPGADRPWRQWAAEEPLPWSGVTVRNRGPSDGGSAPA